MQVLTGAFTRSIKGVRQTEWLVMVPGVFLAEHRDRLHQAFGQIGGNIRSIFCEKMFVDTPPDIPNTVIQSTTKEALQTK